MSLDGLNSFRQFYDPTDNSKPSGKNVESDEQIARRSPRFNDPLKSAYVKKSKKDAAAEKSNKRMNKLQARASPSDRGAN